MTGIKMNDNSKLFKMIQEQIEVAEAKGQPIKTFVKQQIDLLKSSHDEFLKTATKEGYELNNPKLAEIEVGQYSAMRQLAEKIGLPVEEYDKKIKEVRIRVFGEENYKKFYESGDVTEFTPRKNETIDL